MKLATFQVNSPIGPIDRLGAVCSREGEDLWLMDVCGAYAWLLERDGCPDPMRAAEYLLPPDMTAFLANGEPAMQAARKTLAVVQEIREKSDPLPLTPKGGSTLFPLKSVRLRAPVPRPSSLKDFLAFEAHVKRGYEIRREQVPPEWYEMPVYYKGNHRSIIGPDDEIPWPRYTEKLDYELELACVIGRRGRNIRAADAAAYVAGYTIMNDVSARDIQMKEMRCRLGPAKGKDFATVLGPWLVTPDEAGDVRNLAMIARVNGEEWSRGNSGTSRWTFAQMIAHASDEEEIFPGDVLGSGTVGGGCGYELNRWIQPGDLVELEIERLGALRNRVGRR